VPVVNTLPARLIIRGSVAEPAVAGRL
jgi:hypothetical protein